MSRPSDFIDTGFESPRLSGPQLGPFEWLRWAWRQLTSMRTALLLLLALAIAAVPGSLIPQNSSDPNGVVQWKASNPGFVGVADFFQAFDVYTSAWFSSIYLLLFVSLVGCLIPRIRHHLGALRAAPPRTPVNLSRLPAHRTEALPGSREAALAAAEQLFRRRRYRAKRYGDSVSAERGYLRETGNLVFHLALVGILISVFIGGGFSYTGNRILTADGETFTNQASGYDSLTTGRFFSDSALQPYSISLQHLSVRYEEHNAAALGEPLDYTASVFATYPDGSAKHTTIKVNDPLSIGGTNVYLLGNGYSPHVTIRDAQGKVATSNYYPFVPTDANLDSRGVVKVFNGLSKEVGFIGFFYPTAEKQSNGTLISTFPGLVNPILSLNVYEGALDNSNVFTLDPSNLKQIAGPTLPTKSLELKPGETQKLPNGLGTIRFDSVGRFASLDIHHDPSQNWVGIFAVLVVAGLITSLLVPRRRMWMSIAGEHDDGLIVEYAALARGDDPGLEKAVAEFAVAHRAAVEGSRSDDSAARLPTSV